MWHCTQFTKLGKEALSVWDKDKNDLNLGKNSKSNLSVVAYRYNFIFFSG